MRRGNAVRKAAETVRLMREHQASQDRGRTIGEKLTALIEENLGLGCHRVNLGNVRPPAGYEIMLNPDGDHFFWVCFDGRESVIHWDRWATLRGANADAERREAAAASQMFEDEIIEG